MRLQIKLVAGMSLLAGTFFSMGSAAAQPDDPKPAISPNPLSADALAVYRVVLGDFQNNAAGTHPVNLAIQTMPFYLSTMDADCGKDLHMDEGAVNEVHHFRSEDIPVLLSGKMTAANLKLVDPEAQSKEVAENDPDKTIHQGRSIGDAVDNAFAHGLVQLGEIHFDKDHTHAILAISFSCGGLCGNGTTLILEKKDGHWTFRGHCSTSIAAREIPDESLGIATNRV